MRAETFVVELIVYLEIVAFDAFVLVHLAPFLRVAFERIIDERNGSIGFFKVEFRNVGKFALLFRFDGDIRAINHVMYNCSVSRPKIGSKTNEESKEVQTETLTISAKPLVKGYVKAKTGDSTPQTVYDNWFKSVYLPVAAAQAVPATGTK